LRECLRFAGIFTDVPSRSLSIENRLHVDIRPPSEQHNLCVLVQPRVVANGRKRFASIATSTFNEGTRSTRHRIRKVKATGTVSKTLRWIAVAESVDKRAVSLTAIAQVYAIVAKVPARSVILHRDVFKQAVMVGPRSMWVRVRSREELVEVAPKDVDFVWFRPVNGVDWDSVCEPQESMDVA
jgi:hypothetical protein